MRRYTSLLELMREVTLVEIEPRQPAAAHLSALLELALPGAMKDRVALGILETARERGWLRPGGVIVESSSGTMAEGLARVGALMGHRVIVVTDPRIDALTRAKLRALGADLEVVSAPDPQGGWQQARLRRLRDVLARLPEAFWPGQYDNPGNAGAYAAVADRLWQTFEGRLDVLVGPVGSGGSLCGLAARLRSRLPRLRVVAVDAVGSGLFGQPDRPRLQSGHGNSVVPGNIRYQLIDEVHWLSDAEAFLGCRELALRTGIFAGGSSGAAYIVASWVAAGLAPGQHAVVIMPDRGDRYFETIYSDDYLTAHELNAPAAPAPARIVYGVEVARRWSCASLPHGTPAAGYYAPSVRTTREIAAELGLEAWQPWTGDAA